MNEFRGTCLMCAWREHCQKRFSVKTDALWNVICPDFTRDVKIRDIDLAIMASLEARAKSKAGTQVERQLEDDLVEDQLTKWRLLREEKGVDQPTVKQGPVITISREVGAGGSEIGRRLSKKLGMDLMGGQIIQYVAKSARMSTKVIESLDEKEVNIRDSWLASLFESRHLWPDQYLGHLTKVIGTIARYGNAIIMGRGANFILPRGDTFRVRIIAPVDYRARYIMQDRNVSEEEARQYIKKKDKGRKAFNKKYFGMDVTDPSNYDFIINTGKITLDMAVDSIATAFKAWRERPPDIH